MQTFRKLLDQQGFEGGCPKTPCPSSGPPLCSAHDTAAHRHSSLPALLWPPLRHRRRSNAALLAPYATPHHRRRCGCTPHTHHRRRCCCPFPVFFKTSAQHREPCDVHGCFRRPRILPGRFWRVQFYEQRPRATVETLRLP